AEAADAGVTSSWMRDSALPGSALREPQESPRAGLASRRPLRRWRASRGSDRAIPGVGRDAESAVHLHRRAVHLGNGAEICQKLAQGGHVPQRSTAGRAILYKTARPPHLMGT